MALTTVVGCFADRSGLPGLDGPGPRAGCTPACENGGVCVVTQCYCDPVDYSGPSCSEWIDNCEGVDCQHGDCLDRVRSYSCDCDDGWAVDESGSCSVQLTSCSTPNACINGNCDDSAGEVVCSCHPGFEGTNCNIPIGCGTPPEGPESSQTGEFSGTEFGDSVEYICEWGYGPGIEAIVCEADGTWQTPTLVCEDIDECNFGGFGLCNPFGTERCENQDGSFECHCGEGWTGIYCQEWR